MRTLTAVVLALEAQRPAHDPHAPFHVNLGELAKAAGLIPPTPDDDDDAGRRAYAAGKKLAGHTLKDLADAGAFNRYQLEREYDDDGKVRISSLILGTPRGREMKIDAAESLSYSTRRGSVISHSVTILDPARRTRVMAEHADLSATDARELVHIYVALGYDHEHVRITVKPARSVA